MHGEINSNKILVGNLYGEREIAADVGVDGRIIIMKLILKELSYEGNGCSRLLQNTNFYLANYRVASQKTITLTFTAMRASNIMWIEISLE
jgi:hypothetical protein